MIKWYLETWWKIMSRPILFYQTMPEGEWSDKPLTFAAVTSWIFSLGLTGAIFITQYIPIGATLVEGMKARDLLIVSPIILSIALVFFGMTALIVGGIILGISLLLLYANGALLHFSLRFMGGSGELHSMVKGSFYSSAAFSLGLLPAVFSIFTKYDLLAFSQFQIGENIIYYFTCLYMYGLWSIAGKKIENVPRWKAFTAAILPTVILILINIVLNWKIFPRLGRWLT